MNKIHTFTYTVLFMITHAYSHSNRNLGNIFGSKVDIWFSLTNLSSKMCMIKIVNLFSSFVPCLHCMLIFALLYAKTKYIKIYGFVN